MSKFIPKQGDMAEVRDFESESFVKREFISMSSNGRYLCWSEDKNFASVWKYARPVDKFRELKECYELGAKFEYYDEHTKNWYRTNQPNWDENTMYRIRNGITSQAFKKHRKEIVAWWNGVKIEYYNNGIHAWLHVQTPSWSLITDYRIKEPEFKVGEWVQDKISHSILQACKDMIEKNFEKWEPKENEWCVFWHNDFNGNRPFYTVGKFQKEDGEYFDTDGIAWDNIAPLAFIETLKDK